MKKRLVGVLVGCVLALSMAFMLTGCDNPFNKQTYTPESKAATISKPTIGVEGTLRVGVNTNNPPLAGQSSKIVGIDVDIAAAIADEWGLKLEIVDVGANPLTSLQNGTVDMVLGLESSNSDTAISKSAPYINTGIALFSTDANASLPGAGSKISAQSTSMSAWKVTSIYGAEALVNAADLKTAFGNLTNGTAQYVAADAIIGTYAGYSAGIDVHIVGMLEKQGGYCAGVLQTNSALNSEVNRVLSKLSSEGIIALIEKKWMGQAVDLTGAKDVPAAAGTPAAGTTPAGATSGATPDAASGQSAATPGAESTTSQGSATTGVGATLDGTAEPEAPEQ